MDHTVALISRSHQEMCIRDRDEGCSKAVEEVFIELYEKGYIYRGSRIINWCPVCKTSLSDAEVEHEEQEGHFWHIKYPIVGTDDYLEIATTRPETMLGDTAIAVHPDDERYKDIVGKTAILPQMCIRDSCYAGGKNIHNRADKILDVNRICKWEIDRQRHS